MDSAVPPHNREAEVAVIGSMLADRDSLLKAVDILKEDDFYEPAHQILFRGIRELHDRNVAVDVITLSDHLRAQDGFAAFGGSNYLMEIMNVVPSALHVDHYARIVKEKSVLRQMINVSRRIAAESTMEGTDVTELLDQAQQLFFSIAQAKATRAMVASSHLMQKAIATLEQLTENNRLLTGISTGFRDFDKMTKGLQPSNLIIVAGRPSMGKTAICMNIAEHVAIKEKKPVIFFSLEMSDNEVALRLLCSRARINLRMTEEGILARRSWPMITNVASEIAGAPLFFDFSTSPTIMDVRSSARRWAYDLKHKGTPLALIVIDYMQLMRGGSNAESRQQEISEISRSLKALARELEVPVIALSQLNRKTEEKGREGKPQLSDLRESGAIEQDADLVAAIFREEVYRKDDPDLKGKAKLIVLKQRNGPVGEVDLNFLHEFTRFADPSPDEDPF